MERKVYNFTRQLHFTQSPCLVLTWGKG